MSAVRAADEIPTPAVPSVEATAKFGQQQVRQVLAERLPQLSPKAIERIAQGFEEHLRSASRICFENYTSGRLEDGELVSRISVYLHDNPGLLGRPAPSDDVGTRVRKALAVRDTVRAPTERAALAQRFIANLAERSRLAHQNLLAGRMSDEELASRVSVFLEDLRTESAASPGPDPARTAAAELVADQFIRQNFGSPNERATALSYDCTITRTEAGSGQLLRFIRKSPNKVRIHFLNDGLVTLAMAYDGTTAWMQRPSKPVERLSGAQAAILVDTAPFDHPLVGYRERGAQLALRGGGTEPFELTVREPDGRSVTSSIDPLTYQESRQIVGAADGSETELRLRDYRRIGTTNIPYTQETWRNGALLVTTQLDAVSTEATLLDALFAPPETEMVAYMDYMGGLALLQKRAATATTVATEPARPVAPTIP